MSYRPLRASPFPTDGLVTNGLVTNGLVIFGFVGLAAAPGCWLRYAEDPEAAPPPYDGLLPVTSTFAEETDWPNTPWASDLPTVDLGAVAPFEALAVEGVLGPFGGLNIPTVEGERPFGCGETASVLGTYSGDVDFLLLDHPGDTLCVLLAGPDTLTGLTLDVVAYPYDPSCAICATDSTACTGCADEVSRGGCLDGTFLTMPSETSLCAETGQVCEPGWMTIGRVNTLTAPAGTLALYVAGASVEGDGAPPASAPYELYVVRRRLPGCADVSIEDFLVDGGGSTP